MPNAMIRDILVANPQAAKSDSLLDKLEERAIPLPNYMWTEILQGEQIIGAKENLEAKISHWNHKRYFHRNNLFRIFNNEQENGSYSDSLFVLLQNETNLQAKYELAFQHLEFGDSISATSVLSQIPNQFQLSTEQQEEWQGMTNYLTSFSALLTTKPVTIYCSHNFFLFMKKRIIKYLIFLGFCLFNSNLTLGKTAFLSIIQSISFYVHQFTIPDTTQIWPKIYGGNLFTWGEDVDETYDFGYLITGDFVSYSGVFTKGILIKTDINGNLLWERRIGGDQYYLGINNSDMTYDGGLITIGSTAELDEYYDAFIMKLDACGNSDWCKIYSVPNDLDDGVDIVQLPDDGYLALINYYGYDNAYKRVWLFRLDPDGDLLWQKVYCTQNPELAHSWGYKLMVSEDGSFLISGTTAIEYPVGSGLWWGEPLLVKTDPNGEEIFAKAFKYDKNVYHGLGYEAAEDGYGNYLVTSMNYQNPAQQNSPGAIVKFDSNGTGMNWMNLWAPQYWSGTCSTIDFISPDSMFITGGFVTGFDSAFATAYIMDTSGQILREVILKNNTGGNVVNGATLTSDNKSIMTAGFYNGPVAKGDMYLFKMNYNLEYDSLDPRMLTYDSLCPYVPIALDTIVPNCDIIVGLEEAFANPEKSRLKIAPNPATDKVTITLPEVWLSEYITPDLQIQTARYQYPDNMYVEIYNSFGRKIIHYDILSKSRTFTIDLSKCMPGIYIIRILSGNQLIISDKLIIL
ncbi:MAG: T9SS type A sorting domain-containing protein [Bacteroidota bacterium]